MAKQVQDFLYSWFLTVNSSFIDKVYGYYSRLTKKNMLLLSLARMKLGCLYKNHRLFIVRTEVGDCTLTGMHRFDLSDEV